MRKVWILISTHWEFIEDFLTEEGHDPIWVLGGQSVGRVEKQYWKQGEQLGADAVI